MKRVCMICKARLPDVPGDCPGYPGAVSHGYCPVCYEDLVATFAPPALGPVRERIEWSGQPCKCAVCNRRPAGWVAEIEGVFHVPVCEDCREMADEDILNTFKRRKGA